MPNEGERDQNVLRTVLQRGNEEHQEKPGASSLNSQGTRGAVLVLPKELVQKKA